MSKIKQSRLKKVMGLSIGDHVKLKYPKSQYERNLIMKVLNTSEKGFIGCRNIKNKKSYFHLDREDIIIFR